MEKEVWARTEMAVEAAFCWEMIGQTAAVTLVIPNTPVDQDSQQLSWMRGGDIATIQVYVKKIVGRGMSLAEKR